VTLFEFRKYLWRQKTRVPGLSYDYLIRSVTVLIQYRRVTATLTTTAYTALALRRAVKPYDSRLATNYAQSTTNQWCLCITLLELNSDIYRKTKWDYNWCFLNDQRLHKTEGVDNNRHSLMQPSDG